jgi:hypothetical protein
MPEAPFDAGDAVRAVDSVEVRLPAAAPSLYLRWLSFMRSLEAVMHERRPVAELAEQESGASFIEGSGATFVSEIVIPSVRRQASEAIAAGAPLVQPVLSTSRSQLLAWHEWRMREAQWLGLLGGDLPQRVAALGLEPPDDEMHDLMNRASAAIAKAAFTASTEAPDRPADPLRGAS